MGKDVNREEDLLDWVVLAEHFINSDSRRSVLLFPTGSGQEGFKCWLNCGLLTTVKAQLQLLEAAELEFNQTVLSISLLSKKAEVVTGMLLLGPY